MEVGKLSYIDLWVVVDKGKTVPALFILGLAILVYLKENSQMAFENNNNTNVLHSLLQLGLFCLLNTKSV